MTNNITVPRELLEPCAWCKQPAQSILVGVEKRQTISCGNNKCAAFTVVASVEQWNTRVHTLRDVVGAGFSLSRAEQYSAAWQIAENIGYALTAPVPTTREREAIADALEHRIRKFDAAAMRYEHSYYSKTDANLDQKIILALRTQPPAVDDEPVALAHITMEDDGPYARLEVLNGETLQPHMSPVALYTHTQPPAVGVKAAEQ